MSEKELRQRVLYFIFVIQDFSERYKIPVRNAFLYIQRYKGLDFLEEHYAAEHLLSMEDVLDDVTKVCQKNGGGISVC